MDYDLQKLVTLFLPKNIITFNCSKTFHLISILQCIVWKQPFKISSRVRYYHHTQHELNSVNPIFRATHAPNLHCQHTISFLPMLSSVYHATNKNPATLTNQQRYDRLSLTPSITHSYNANKLQTNNHIDKGGHNKIVHSVRSGHSRDNMCFA